MINSFSLNRGVFLEQSILMSKGTEEIKKVIISGNIANGYLFLMKSSDDISFAEEFAKSILCDSPVNGVPCLNCSSCVAFQTSPDYRVIVPENGVIKVDAIRCTIEELFIKPSISKKKVILISEADKMNEQAQNALLKALEEPPLYACIILVASSKDKLLNTIKSRVVEYSFLSVDRANLIEHIDNSDSFYNYATALYSLFSTKDFLKINKKFEEIKSDKALKASIVDILQRVIYISYKNIKSDTLYNVNLISELENTIEKIGKNANVDLSIDELMINICGL